MPRDIRPVTTVTDTLPLLNLVRETAKISGISRTELYRCIANGTLRARNSPSSRRSVGDDRLVACVGDRISGGLRPRDRSISSKVKDKSPTQWRDLRQRVTEDQSVGPRAIQSSSIGGSP
jgi:hypothetical protein